KQPAFFRFGVERRGRLNFSENQREFGQELDEFGDKWAEQCFDFRRIVPGEEIAQGIDPQRVRKGNILLKTMPLQHDKALAYGTLAQLVEKTALAHARLAANQDAMTLSPLCSLQRLPKRTQLGLTANDYGRDDLGGIGRHARNPTLPTERLSNEVSPFVVHTNTGWHSAATPQK